MSDKTSNFLVERIESDLAEGKNGGRVVTRFPPEPNGFLHVGHAKSILLNFGLARRFNGRTHLRFDDTNPTTEETAYVEAIQRDVRWLGCDWGEHLHFASDYFERMYACAVRLVRDGLAYVDRQGVDAIREQRGSFERPGSNSPFRETGVEENLAFLERMRKGDFADGEAVLRARIDMAHPNLLMRDPLLYRIRHARHHRTGDAWSIYPMYDFAHPLEDAFEGVTHSICTLEFESNRELYDWVLDHTGPWDPRPRQYEFARLQLSYTVLSKRKLLQLVKEHHVTGWDDPRMPTLAGMRRRGVTPEALWAFNERIGVAKNNSVVDLGKLEFALRTDLEARTPRAMAVLEPLALELTDWPEERVDEVEIPWWPSEPAKGSRKVPLGRHLLIEREDFSDAPPKGWKRLAPGGVIRLAGTELVIRCDEVLRGADGGVRGLRCSRVTGGLAEEVKPRGTIHWVHQERSVPAAVRLYDRLFTVEQPDAEEDFLSVLNPESLKVSEGARVEPALANAEPGSHWQLLRLGYFHADPVDSRPGAPVLNRVVTLKDTWANRSGRVEGEATKAPPAEVVPESKREASDEDRKRRAEARAAERAADPERNARFERYRAELKLPEDTAEHLASEPALARYFDAAVGAHPNATPVSKWLINELLGRVKSADLETCALPGEGFGRFVALVDAGRLTQSAGKSLLSELLEKGGDPEARMKALGLEKVEDAVAVDAAIDRALAAHAAEVERFRAGEKKLLGVLIGAAMRETQGAADPAVVRKRLGEKLGG